MAKKSFTLFWVALERPKEAKERAKWVLRPVRKYFPKAKKVLELGVGLGQVLKYFKKFDKYGLDVEKEYINICKKKIPSGKFFKSSMHNFKIKERFDVIFSVYDSINFLKDFEKWKKTFENVNKHLVDEGLFVFDMYTQKILKDFKGKKATVSKFSLGELHDKPIIKDNNLIWDIKIFEKSKKYHYRFAESIFPVVRVKSALSKHFKILETKLMENKRRILFVCKKK